MRITYSNVVNPNEEPQIVTSDNPVDKDGQPIHRRSNDGIKSVFSTVLLLLLAPLIALGLTMYVFQSYQVDGPSMQETLQHNDRLVVWKLPRTWANLTGNDYIPARGDIVILHEAGLESFGAADGGDKQLVKRVLGLPGDRIVIRDGVITVYNTTYPDGYRPDEELPYGKTAQLPPTVNDIEVTLGEDELYVVGDNRTNSLDSRIFGPVKADQVVGKLVLRLLPLNQIETF